MADKYSVPAVDKAFEILEFLSEQKTGLTKAEIACGINRNINEIYRVLINLEAKGYLVQDPSSSRYKMSLKLFTLTRRIDPMSHIAQTALPVMEEFAFEFGVSCHLFTLYKSKAMMALQASSHDAISMQIMEGTLFDLFSLGAGKLLMANSNAEVQKMLIDRDEQLSQQAKDDEFSLKETIHQLRRTKFCRHVSDKLPGVIELSSLIGANDGKIIAALSIMGLGLNAAKEQALKQALADCTNKISTELSLL
ncbi:IclR family transcriptional regulator [Agaribacter flavus]|uniref:IclR family transcriptional regulator n=1 Tax=Agaribacter flavus TaxID=1902781 RepID=A0ABV7FQB9_9ALTE